MSTGYETESSPSAIGAAAEEPPPACRCAPCQRVQQRDGWSRPYAPGPADAVAGALHELSDCPAYAREGILCNVCLRVAIRLARAIVEGLTTAAAAAGPPADADAIVTIREGQVPLW